MTNYSRSVLKSNGLRYSKNLPVKFGFSPIDTPATIAKKLPSQRCSKPLFIPIFNFSHKWPTFAFTGESGYTLGFRRKIAHKGTHGETRGKTRSRPSRGGSAGLRCCAWEAFTPAFPRPSFQSSPTGSAFLPVSSPCCREPCALSCSQCAGMFQTDPIHYPVFPCR